MTIEESDGTTEFGTTNWTERISELRDVQFRLEEKGQFADAKAISKVVDGIEDWIHLSIGDSRSKGRPSSDERPPKITCAADVPIRVPPEFPKVVRDRGRWRVDLDDDDEGRWYSLDRSPMNVLALVVHLSHKTWATPEFLRLVAVRAAVAFGWDVYHDRE